MIPPGQRCRAAARICLKYMFVGDFALGTDDRDQAIDVFGARLLRCGKSL